MSAWPTFSEAYANFGDPGAHFHAFVTDVFALRHPDLSSFMAPGKDGAIDASDRPQGYVWECKFVGESGYDAAMKRWKEVAAHLQNNLEPHRPRPGAGQYGPWYDQQRPITHYRFCTSHWIGNESSVEKLELEIKTTFVRLSGRAGLTHLAGIAVEVWGWERFAPLLAIQPALRLRWFGRGRLPEGMQSFEQWKNAYLKQGFHAYLFGDKLRYVPFGDKSFAPEALLEHICADISRPSTVVHGRGGAGKSRLLAEVGKEAADNGWVVVSAQAHRLTTTALNELGRLCGDTPCLVLVDYVERCGAFDDLVHEALALNDVGASLHLLGSCRDSHVPRLDTYGLTLVGLPSDLAQTVSSILAQRAGLEELGAVCAGVPVFAGFLCLLFDQGRQAEIEELRRDGDFARWLQQHVARLPVPENISAVKAASALAELLASLPATDATVERLVQSNTLVELYRDALFVEGWLINDLEAPEDARWSVVHDIVADGAVLAAVNAPGDPKVKVRQWLAHACNTGAVRAMLRSLQRVSHELAIEQLPWELIFEDTNGQWQDWIESILQTSLIPLNKALPWLDSQSFDREHCVSLRAVHKLLTLLVLERRRHMPGDLRDDEDLLLLWVDSACSAFNGRGIPVAPNNRNDILTNVLLWRPFRYQPAVEEWLTTNADQIHARFPLGAWIGLAKEGRLNNSMGALFQAKIWLSKWFDQHVQTPAASGVFKLWLDAGGDKDAAQQYAERWLALEANATSYRVSTVLESWFAATGNTNTLPRSIHAWLNVQTNAQSLKACSVVKYWLEAGGEIEAIDACFQRWLAIGSNGTTFLAGHLYRVYGDRMRGLPDWLFPHVCQWIQRWVDSPTAVYAMKWVVHRIDLDIPTVTAIVRWCEHFPDLEDTVYRLARALRSSKTLALDGGWLLTVICNVLRRSVATSSKRITKHQSISALMLIATGFRFPAGEATEPSAELDLALLLCEVLRRLPPDALIDINMRLHGLLLCHAWPQLIKIALDNGEPIDPALIAGFQQLTNASKQWLGWVGNFDAAMNRTLIRLTSGVTLPRFDVHHFTQP